MLSRTELAQWGHDAGEYKATAEQLVEWLEQIRGDDECNETCPSWDYCGDPDEEALWPCEAAKKAARVWLGEWDNG